MSNQKLNYDMDYQISRIKQQSEIVKMFQPEKEKREQLSIEKASEFYEKIQNA